MSSRNIEFVMTKNLVNSEFESLAEVALEHFAEVGFNKSTVTSWKINLAELGLKPRLIRMKNHDRILIGSI